VCTDLHARNGAAPVRDLATTMTKLLHLGLDLRSVLAAATAGPAGALGLGREIGTLRPGACADVTLFRMRLGPFEVRDSEGRVERARESIEPVCAVRAGAVLPCGTGPAGAEPATPSGARFRA
jgi:dihydroorotase